MPILGTVASQFSGKPFSSYESIETVTVGAGGAANITFSSIPATYKHLQVRGIVRSTRALSQAGLILRLNSDTGNNYSWHFLIANGSSVSSGNTSGLPSFMYLGEQPAGDATSGVFGSVIIDILDYTNTNKYKTVRTLSGQDRSGSGEVGIISGSWRNTNTITSLTISEDVSSIAQFSSVGLYGIKAA